MTSLLPQINNGIGFTIPSASPNDINGAVSDFKNYIKAGLSSMDSAENSKKEKNKKK